MSLRDPRYSHRPKLLEDDPIAAETRGTRRTLIQQDWEFIKRLRWAIQVGHETARGVLGRPTERP
jgi:hypothetical protein